MDSSIPKAVGDPHDPDTDPFETREWIEALDALIEAEGPERATFLLRRLLQHARARRVPLPQVLATPYVNTIALAEQPPYQGNLEIESRISALVRWNALAMVVRANRASGELGGHIASYASAADLFEVGFNHFFRGGAQGDLVYFQPHSAPGVYARAYLEGRLEESQLDNYRRETGGNGLSSYPHPWLMPGFWQYPTGSMGLGPLFARDTHQWLEKRFLETVDGEFQTYAATDGAFNREHFFNKYPELQQLVAHLSDEDIDRLRRGGHDPVKIFSAYWHAARHTGQPTVILAKTKKGYGMGTAAQGRMTGHQQKELDTEQLIAFRDRFAVPLTDAQ